MCLVIPLSQVEPGAVNLLSDASTGVQTDTTAGSDLESFPAVVSSLLRWLLCKDYSAIGDVQAFLGSAAQLSTLQVVEATAVRRGACGGADARFFVAEVQFDAAYARYFAGVEAYQREPRAAAANGHGGVGEIKLAVGSEEERAHVFTLNGVWGEESNETYIIFLNICHSIPDSHLRKDRIDDVAGGFCI